LGKLCWTLGHIELLLESEYFRLDEITKPFENNSWLILSLCYIWVAFSACLPFLYWSYWILVWWLGSSQRWVISLLGEYFKLFQMLFWHCMNLIEGSTRLMPYFDLLIICLLNNALMENSNHCLIYFETMLSRFSMIQVLIISAMGRFQEIFTSRWRW